MRESFTIPDLASRLGMEAASVLSLVRQGVIECSSRHWPQPIISQLAATEFCLAVGLGLWRLR